MSTRTDKNKLTASNKEVPAANEAQKQATHTERHPSQPGPTDAPQQSSPAHSPTEGVQPTEAPNPARAVALQAGLYERPMNNPSPTPPAPDDPPLPPIRLGPGQVTGGGPVSGGQAGAHKTEQG